MTLPGLTLAVRTRPPVRRDLPPALYVHGLGGSSLNWSALMREMELFPEWFLSRHLSLAPDAAERAVVKGAFEWLCDEALAQPVVLVHRDFHSRNLLVRPDGNPGVIDFQDAVRGPVTYDLVSLLKDCYVVWPRKRMLAWLDRYREKAGAAPLLLLMITVIVSDTAQYYTGRAVGRRPLAATISPKKTVEGFFGSLLGACVGALLAHFWYLPTLPLGHALESATPITEPSESELAAWPRTDRDVAERPAARHRQSRRGRRESRDGLLVREAGAPQRRDRPRHAVCEALSLPRATAKIGS